MIRHRLLILSLAWLGLAAPPALAQPASGGYLPPQGTPGPYDNQAPRSILPPQGNGAYNNPGYGQPYSAPPPASASRDATGNYDGPPPQPGTYSSNEILDKGHHFFGSVSQGLAGVMEHAFKRNGRPNGYILGEEAGGAVYWQGPSLGYDLGANGSKVLTLVYNLQYTSQIYDRFGGVDGSAYFVGGVGITFQQHDDVILAPIRAGVGLRLGANVGYLKYTPSPTWNPF
ncbi:MAG: DUF1134 domain-containing protein [Rhodomicrobium sp.]|nr:DUF1134 domain-containing protein [Rhodomicrobium sp.]